MPQRYFTFERTVFEIADSLCFVMMPFRPDLDEVYMDIIKPVVESNTVSMECIRADEIYSSGAVLHDIWTEIQRARLIVADLTGRNPNAFYELGLAHTVQKPVILLAQNIEDIPFDLRHLRFILYTHTPRGATKLKEELTATILNVLQEPLEGKFGTNGLTDELIARIGKLERRITYLHEENSKLLSQVRTNAVAAAMFRQYTGLKVLEEPAQVISKVKQEIRQQNIPPQFVNWDGAEYILISGGPCLLGRAGRGNSSEEPQHEVYLEPFYLSKYLVTNIQFFRFMQATERLAPAYWVNGEVPRGKAGHPVVGVTWYDAKAYADWVGGRLPSEAEWEKASSWVASEKRKLVYPWGNEFSKSNLNCFDTGPKVTTSVETYSDGASPYGLVDMVGNVWEWTSSLFAEYPYAPDDGREDQEARGYRVVRGGSWLAPKNNCYCTYRNGEISKFFSVDLGFRVAVDIPA